MDTLIQVTNTGRQPLLLVAHHQQVCVRAGRCTCTAGMPAAYHVPAGATVQLPVTVAGCVDAQVALRQRTLAIVAVPPVPPQSAPIPSPPAGDGKASAERAGRRNK